MDNDNRHKTKFESIKQQHEAVEVGSNQSFIIAQVDDNKAVELAHAVNYSYMHLPTYHADLNAVRFTHEEFMYAVIGENMFNLLQAINARSLSEIIEGKAYKIGHLEFTVKDVFIEAVADQEASPQDE